MERVLLAAGEQIGHEKHVPRMSTPGVAFLREERPVHALVEKGQCCYVDSSLTEQHTSGEQQPEDNGSGAPPLDTPNTLSSPSEDGKKGSDQTVKEKGSRTRLQTNH